MNTTPDKFGFSILQYFQLLLALFLGVLTLAAIRGCPF
jgi:hypothetical protein